METPVLLRNPARFGTAFLWCLFAGYLAFIGFEYAQGFRAAERGDRPLYTDFTPTYAASLLLREYPPEMLYHPPTMHAAQLKATHAVYAGISTTQARAIGFSPWQYPPTFILAVAPLALLPYFPALFAWLALSAVPYLLAMRSILPTGLALPAALAAPPVFYNLMYGQTGFLSGGLIALGLLALKKRPLLAGICIGLASFKPHLGLLLPFALAAGGHWHCFAAATATVLALIGASMAAFGLEPWYAFIGTLEFQRQGFEVGAYNYRPMTTLLATLRLAGMPLAEASGVQALVSLLLIGLILRYWRSPDGDARSVRLRNALLCIATPLALPLAFIYDLVLVVPALAWLWGDLTEHPRRQSETAVLWLATLGLLICVPLARHVGVQIGAPSLALLLGLVLVRLRQTRP